MAGEKSQGAILSVSTAEAAADTISGATAANPVVITATSHGISNSAIVRVTGVGGMTQINDRAFVTANVATNAFDLKGINGTAYSAYTSGGSAYAQTMQAIGYVDNIGPGFDGQAAEIDKTHLRSLAREVEGGLPDFGQVAFSFLDVAGSDAGQQRLIALHESQAIVAWSITMASGRISAFLGFVKQLPFDPIAPDTMLKGSGIIRVSNFPSRFV